MLRMWLADQNDGSFRLYSACCRCVVHDLTDSEAIQCRRTYASQRPFPQEWSDETLLARLKMPNAPAYVGQR